MKAIYTEEILQLMRDFFYKLPERSRRLYAALESLKLGHGGIIYISQILKIDRKTIRRGRKELEYLCGSVSDSRQRKAGGGRKKKLRPIANFGKS
jgi:hypothetical protein